MRSTRFATPLMLSLTAVGSLGLASAQAGIVDLPAGYGLVQDSTKAPQTPPAQDAAKTQQEHRCGARHAEQAKTKEPAEASCGADHAQHAQHDKDHHEGRCGADHHAPTEAAKTEQEGKCGEGKCGEGKCGGMA